MSTHHGETNDADNNSKRGSTAESTHFRGGVFASGDQPPHDGDHARMPDFHPAGPKSIRTRVRISSGGLAAKIAAPVILAMLIGLLVVCIILQRKVFTLQLDDVKNDAANSTYILSVLGRMLIVHRDEFLAANPGYLSAAEWRSGDHWLVKNHFVGPDEWAKATGVANNAMAPVSVLERAAESTILMSLNRWLNAKDTFTEMVALVILDKNDNRLAAIFNTGFRLDPAALRPPPDLKTEDNGPRIDYLAEYDPEPVVRAVMRISANQDSGPAIGTVLVMVKTGNLNLDQHAFLIDVFWLALLLLVFMALVCWVTARAVTAPMRRLAADMLALAEGDYSRRSPLVGSDEIGMLSQAFNSMAERLRVARSSEKENSRLESDLAIARNIQKNLLPPQTPRVRGLDIHTAYRPAREIGGDYFDFLQIDAQHMGIVVADASGKSIPAALVMSTTRAILRFVAPGNNSAAETLSRVNSILSVDIPRGMFVTAYYLILDPLNNTMVCASAGHTPLLIARPDDSVELLNPGGIALGFDTGAIFQRSIKERKVPLAKGDRVLVYTDGVVECVNAANEEYSDRRLKEFARRNRDLSSHDFIGALLADLDRHRGTAEIRDDTTIVTFKVL